MDLYDLIIIGGGPAGVAAGVYAARKRLKTLLITPEWGGQSIVSEGIENWIGTVKVSGTDFAKMLKEHLLAYASNIVEVKEGETVQDIELLPRGTLGRLVNSPMSNSPMSDIGEGKLVVITNKAEYQTKTVLVTTGSSRRKLEIPGAKEFDNKGLTYCASCDGPLFADQDVIVIGGGNAAFETSAQLLAYCKSITLLNRSLQFRADEIIINKLKQNPKFKIITNAVPVEIKGDQFVTGIVYEDTTKKERYEIQTPGIFVEIGLIPTTYFVKNIIELNQIGQIPVDPKTQKTKVSGIWAAGDCSDTLYHQNNIAAGDAVRALEDIYMHLHAR